MHNLKRIYLGSLMFCSVFSYSCTSSINPPDDVTNDIKVDSSHYKINFNKEEQTILGLGVEIQSDRFGPKYDASDPVNGIPYDLIPSERTRLATELVSGFRYLRVAMGLWFRGLTNNDKNFTERYPEQLALIKEMMAEAKMEGISLEYWSPAPYWKSTYNLIGGTLRSYDAAFLSGFGDALAQDVQYFKNNGVKVSTWGLQNEPMNGDGNYPQCNYSDDNYFKTFKAVAPKIRTISPETEIIVDTKNGNYGTLGNLIRADATAQQYVDSWVYHRSGQNSDNVIDARDKYLYKTLDKPVYQNEWAYDGEEVKTSSGEWRMVNLAQSIMNWMTFVNSPKWYFLHILKPTNDSNWEGFGLGYYRRNDDNDFSKFPDVAKGTFKHNWRNFNGIAGFLKYMEWDSKRIDVTEDSVRYDHRIMAWRKPDGKHVFALTNRTTEEFDFVIELDKVRIFSGHRYNRDFIDQTLPAISGKNTYKIRVKPMSIEFWTEEDTTSENLSINNTPVNAYRTKEKVIVQGVREGETIKVFHTNGQQIKEIIADSNPFSFSIQSKEILLIRTSLKTLKI